MTTYTHIVTTGSAGVRPGAISSPSQFEFTLFRSGARGGRPARLVPRGRHVKTGRGDDPGNLGQRVSERERRVRDARPASEDDGVEPADLSGTADGHREGCRAETQENERAQLGQDAEAEKLRRAAAHRGQPDDQGGEQGERGAVESGAGRVDMLADRPSLLVRRACILAQAPAERCASTVRANSSSNSVARARSEPIIETRKNETTTASTRFRGTNHPAC